MRFVRYRNAISSAGWVLRRYLFIHLPRGRFLILGAAIWTRDPITASCTCTTSGSLGCVVHHR